ncbi:MAG: hypothetical protein K8S27_14830 [Candidatus Omnitrophica bacterium]|nr:hypothetical protein [Candidatus Omnitrophota bacterium]
MSVIFFIFQMLKPEPRPQQSEPVDNSATDGLPQSNPGYKALLCLTILLAIYYCIYMIWCVNHLPVYTWDSIATSVYNSKILFYEKSLSAQKNFAHLSYPLQFPIIITWISLHLGEWNDQAIKYLFPVTFIMFTILLHHFLSLWVGKKKALWGVLMLFSSNFLIYHATISYRDILMMFYVVGSILFMFEWNRTKLIGYLILSALFIGFSTFLKLEGTAYALILGLTLLYTLYLNRNQKNQSNLKALIHFCFPILFLWGSYIVYKSQMHFPSSEYVEINMFNIFSRTFLTVKAFYCTIFTNANWNIIWIILLIVTIKEWKTVVKKTHLHLLYLPLILFLGLHFTLGTLSDKGDHVISSSTLCRLFIHFFPLTIVIILFLFDFSPTKKHKEKLL